MDVLVGDIGGTHARLAVMSIDGAHWKIQRQQDYRSADFPGLPAVVRAFTATLEKVPDRACFGVACPVNDGICRLTNLEWVVDASRLSQEVGVARAGLVNDFHAVALALPLLAEDDLVVLQAGQPVAHGAMAIIGAGTGLGQSLLVWDGKAYQVLPSEGGHADFAPRSRLEAQLFVYLLERFGHVSYERLLSGPGLVNLYRFLVDSGIGTEQRAVRAEMEDGDPAAVISRHGLEGTDAVCVRALDLFAEIYGAQAGNLALTVRAEGGVYLAGGIAPVILEKLRDGTFLQAFTGKGRMASLLERVPVRVIVNPNTGLIGAAAAARDLS